MCYEPIKGVLLKWYEPKTGELLQRIQVCKNPDLVVQSAKNKYNDVEVIDLPCGNCFECLQQRSVEWSYRIMAEFESNNNVGMFITLTYANAPKELIKRDYQLFLKRLRKHFEPQKLRYFGCGEYGSKKQRPHYHFIIFGVKFDDLEYFKNDGGVKLYRSKTLEKLWPLGFSSVGDVTLNSAKYCAKYLQKRDKNGLQPFITMSLKPGIGAKYFESHYNLLNSDKLYFNGGYVKLPRYFLKMAQKNCVDISELKNFRLKKAKLLKRSDLENLKKKQSFESKLFD